MGMELDQWQNCYQLNWKGYITDESHSHPAKFSRGLINKILSHLFEEGRIKKGDTILDPFGGVACGGIVCAYKGLKWVGVELEPRFIELGNKNIELHRSKWEHTKCPIPQLIQGDSRKLVDTLAEADVIMSSPPYASEPTIASGVQRNENGWRKGKDLSAGKSKGYGKTQGQLSGLSEGSVDSVVTSPPYEGTPLQKSEEYWEEKLKKRPELRYALRRHEGNKSIGSNAKGGPTAYGESNEQLATLSGNTFWQAARDIVLQCYQVLKSGGVAVWVCKDFVRNKQRVPFSDDWLKLCIACGFEPLCRHQAMLVKKSQVIGLDGVRGKDKERKSFFRRLAEKKGSPKIDHEDVLCVIKE